MVAMSGNQQVETEPEQMRGVALWAAVIVGCALLFGPAIWVIWPH